MRHSLIEPPSRCRKTFPQIAGNHREQHWSEGGESDRVASATGREELAEAK